MLKTLESISSDRKFEVRLSGNYKIYKFEMCMWMFESIQTAHCRNDSSGFCFFSFNPEKLITHIIVLYSRTESCTDVKLFYLCRLRCRLLYKHLSGLTWQKNELDSSMYIQIRKNPSWRFFLKIDFLKLLTMLRVEHCSEILTFSLSTYFPNVRVKT